MQKQIILILILLIFIPISLSFIVLPIDTLPRENYKLSSDNNPHNDYINSQYQSIFFTELEMGTPSQKIPLLLKTEVSSYIVTSINSIEGCTSYKYRDVYNFSESFFNNYDFYNESKSKSFILNDCDYGRFYEAEQVCNSNETFSFYQDINLKNKTIKEKVYFEFMRNVEDNITGEIGLNLYDKNKRSFNSFLNILKTNKLIDNYNWYFHFDSWDNNKGKLIVGSLPHEDFPKNYIEDDLNYAKVESNSFLNYWRMQFDKIYIKSNNNINIYFNETVAEFKFDNNIIIGTYEYENYLLSIIGKYLDQQKCFSSNISDYKLYSNKLRFYYCKNENNIKNELYDLIPTIYLYYNQFNYTIEIKKDDLFKINNGYIYYQVLFGTQNNKIWFLGRPISLKYKFVFNPETKQIGFYRKYYNDNEDSSANKSDNNNNNNNSLIIKICVIIVLSILLVALGVIIGKKIYGIKKKKRANELLDDYDYTTDENNNNNVYNVNENIGINN